jgi:hypothetical protein
MQMTIVPVYKTYNRRKWTNNRIEWFMNEFLDILPSHSYMAAYTETARSSLTH